MNWKLSGKRSLSWLAALTVCLSALGVVLPALPAAAEETPVYLDTGYSFAERAADLVSRMTLAEKVSQLGNNAPAIPRLGITAYDYWSEGLHGVARSGYATSFPTAYGIAQTWNPDLVQEIVTITSDEARAYNNQTGKGLSYWSPTINMSRDPRWGRAEETYGEDPYLATQIGAGFVRGLEGTDEDTGYLKAIATIKHYALNNTEQFRHNGSSDIDDATLREYYTRAYKDIVQETGVHSLMTAYNEVNGVPSAANTYLLETLLRRTFGFTGYVTSDCGAINDIYTNHKWVPEGWDHAVDAAEATALCIIAGNDLECGGVFRSNAQAAVQRGLMTEDDIDVALVRMFTARMETGEWDPAEDVPYRDTDQYGWDASYGSAGNNLATGAPVLTSTEYAVETALRSSEEAVALLKNEPAEGSSTPLLPLDATKMDNVVIVGENELINNLILGDYSGTPLPENVSKPFDGIQKVLRSINPNATLTYVQSGAGSSDFYGNFANTILMDADGNALTTLVPGNVADTDARVEGGGANFGYVYNGSYAAFNNVSVDEVTQVTIMASGNTSHGTIEIHMDAKDGPIIGTVETKATSGWGDYKAYTGTFDANAKGFTGTHTLYLVCNSGAEYQAFTAQQETTIRNADAVITYVGTRQSDSGEENDRRNINFPRFQSNMVQAVADLNPNTVVYISSVGQMNVEDFKDDVPAIFWATYNGQAQGEAAGNLIFGKANPSGHLTFTWYSDLTELSAITDYTLASGEESNGRTYQYYTGKVSYPFGHGLSYSSFEYSNMQIEGLSAAAYQMGDVDGDGRVEAEDALTALQAATRKITLSTAQITRAEVDGTDGLTANDALQILQCATQKITLPAIAGGDDVITPDDTLTVTVDVTNVSEVDGAEVVQAYVSSPRADKVTRPAQQLKGFEKVFIAAGETETVSIELKVADWYFWDEEAGKNVYDQGEWTIGIGASSGDIRESQTVTMDGELTPAVAVVTAIPSGHTLDLSAKTITTDLSVVMNDDSFCELSKAEIVYTSSDPAVATVDEHGNVRSVAPGVATITVTATVNGTTGTASFPVAVKDEIAISGITINGEPIQGFIPSTTNYTVQLAEDVTEAVVGTPDEGSHVVVTQATSLPGTATITVTRGETVVTYSIYLYRPHTPVSTDFTAIDALPDDWRVYSNGSTMGENPDNWALTENGLAITSEAGDIYQAHNNSQNIFVQDADGDWVADTKVTMDKGFGGGYQQLAFMAFQDEDNYLKFSYESGNRIKVVQEIGGTSNEKQPQTGGMQSSGLVQYFRIQKSGNEYTFYTSADGVSFELLTKVTCGLQNVKLALTAVNSFNGTPAPITATFEYVNVVAMADCTCEIDTVICEDQVLDLAAVMTGATPLASVTVKGDCPIPSHQTPSADYTYALKTGGENTANVTVTNNRLQGMQQGYVDITVTARLANGSTGTADARITVQSVESSLVAWFFQEEQTAADVHTMQITTNLPTGINLTAYADQKLYLEYDVKVESTHTNPAPANDDWVKYIINGRVSINGTQVDVLGYNRAPMPSFSKAGEWTTFKVELPATVTGLVSIDQVQFLVYNDTGSKYTASTEYVDNGITWNDNTGVAISVRNVKITTNG